MKRGQQRLGALRARVEELERKIALLGRCDQPVVRAAGFELVDSEARVRASLRIWPHGGPTLAFFDAAEQVRLVVGLEGDHPLMVLTDKGGGRRVDLRVLRTGTPLLALCDAKGRPRFKLDLAGAHGEPCLVMLDQEGKPKVGAMISDRTGEGIAGTRSAAGGDS